MFVKILRADTPDSTRSTVLNCTLKRIRLLISPNSDVGSLKFIPLFILDEKKIKTWNGMFNIIVCQKQLKPSFTNSIYSKNKYFYLSN